MPLCTSFVSAATRIRIDALAACYTLPMVPSFFEWYRSFSTSDKISFWLFCAQVAVSVLQAATLGIIAWSTIIARRQQRDFKRQIDSLPVQLDISRLQLAAADRQTSITLSALSESLRPLLVVFNVERRSPNWNLRIENQGAGAALEIRWGNSGEKTERPLTPNILGPGRSTELSVEERDFLQRGISFHYRMSGGWTFETEVLFRDGLVICEYIDHHANSLAELSK